MAEIGKFHEEAIKSGVIVSTGRLSQTTTRVRKDGDQVSVTDGPFIEGKELIPGFTVIRVDTKQEGDRVGHPLSGHDGHAGVTDRRDLRLAPGRNGPRLIAPLARDSDSARGKVEHARRGNARIVEGGDDSSPVRRSSGRGQRCPVRDTTRL